MGSLRGGGRGGGEGEEEVVLGGGDIGDGDVAAFDDVFQLLLQGWSL